MPYAGRCFQYMKHTPTAQKIIPKLPPHGEKIPTKRLAITEEIFHSGVNHGVVETYGRRQAKTATMPYIAAAIGWKF